MKAGLTKPLPELCPSRAAGRTAFMARSDSGKWLQTACAIDRREAFCRRPCVEADKVLFPDAL